MKHLRKSAGQETAPAQNTLFINHGEPRYKGNICTSGEGIESFDAGRRPFDEKWRSFDAGRRPFDEKWRSFDAGRHPFDERSRSFDAGRRLEEDWQNI